MDSSSAMVRWVHRPEGSNWGNFGPDDQVGRMNLITNTIRRAAMDEVVDGQAFALSLPLDCPGGVGLADSRLPPRLFSSVHDGHQMSNLPLGDSDVCNDDAVTLFTQYSTQWDSLAHWGRLFDADGDGLAEPVFYNGYRADLQVRAGTRSEGMGSQSLGIENLAVTGVQGRGVLVNLVEAFGPERTWIDLARLKDAMRAQNVEVRPGDFLLLYTGFGDELMRMYGAPDRVALEKVGAVLDGSDNALLEWIDKSGVVAICSDNMAVEGFDPALQKSGVKGLLPLHDLCLFRLGIHLGELWWLTDLARYLAEHRRHAFLLTAPPLRLPGAVGSPVTPVATV